MGEGSQACAQPSAHHPSSACRSRAARLLGLLCLMATVECTPCSECTSGFTCSSVLHNCGWCSSIGSCVVGSSGGPSSGSCPQDEWVWLADECPLLPPSPPLPPSTPPVPPVAPVPSGTHFAWPTEVGGRGLEGLLKSANSGDKIVLANGTYIPEWGDGVNALVVDKKVEICALHPGQVILDGRGTLRIFQLRPNAWLILNGVVITGGKAAVEMTPEGNAVAGAALKLEFGARAELTNVTIANITVASTSHAVVGGLLLANHYTSISLTGVTITNITVTALEGIAGGLLFLVENANARLSHAIITNVNVTASTYVRGGLVDLFRNAGAEFMSVAISNIFITRSGVAIESVSLEGGLLRAYESNALLTNVTLSSFTATSSATTAGALLYLYSDVSTSNVVLANTAIIDVTITVPTGDAHVFGGLLCITLAPGSARAARAVLTNVSITSVNITLPIELRGGVLYLRGNPSAELTGVVIANVFATSSSTLVGGVLFMEEPDARAVLTSVTIVNVFSESDASVSGVCLYSTGTLQLSYTNISRCITGTGPSRGGGAYISNGQLRMDNATMFRDNRASTGSSLYIDGGTAFYTLPSYPGSWVPAKMCEVYREACASSFGIPKDPNCTSHRASCSRLVNGSEDPHCTPTLFAQPCDWQTNPQLLGKLVQPLPQGAINDAYPPQCLPGLLGSSEQEHQMSADCAGRTPAGTYQPFLGGTVAHECTPGHYCPEGAAWPLACEGGSFTALTNLSAATQCTRAQPGYMASAGSVAQTPCLAGYVAGAHGSARCEPCPSGTVPNNARRLCVDCPPGHWCEGGNAIACGKYLYTNTTAPATSRKSLHACLECPQNATTVTTGTTSLAGCICERQFYAVVVPLRNADNTEQCLPCPPFMTCDAENTTLQTLTVDSRYWRPGSASAVAKLCPSPFTCTGGSMASTVQYDPSSNATCAPGRGTRGAYCTLCIDPTSHFFDEQASRCKACTALETMAAVALMLLVATAVSVLYWRRRERLAVFAARVSLRAKLRIIISFYQVVAQLDSVYSLRFPAVYIYLVKAIDIFNLNAFSWLSGLHPVCIGLPSLLSQLWFATLVPLGIALVVLAVVWRATGMPSASLPFIIWWTFLLFPSISSRGFRALAPCDCFPYADGGEVCFSRVDYSIECSGSSVGGTPAPIFYAAWAAIAIWGVAIPLILYPALLCMRDASVRMKLRVLTGDVKSRAIYWELVVVIEKLLLTGFLSLFQPGSWLQIFVAVLVAHGVFILQARVSPYKRSDDNFFAFCTAAMLMLELLGSLGIQATALSPGMINQTFLLIVLFMATVCILALAAAFFVLEIYSAMEPTFKLRESNVPPELVATPGKRWDLFLSHQWGNQDVVATIKRQLQLHLPGVQVFLDVDNLDNLDRLELHVQESTSMLILLGSPAYFASWNCQREVASAMANGLPLILVHEADPQKNGAPIELLEAACPEDMHDFVFGTQPRRPIIPWHRVRPFQLVSLAEIASTMMHASSVYEKPELVLSGALAWATLVCDTRLSVYANVEDNMDVRKVLAAVDKLLPGRISVRTDPASLRRSARSWPSLRMSSHRRSSASLYGDRSVNSFASSTAWLLWLTVDAFEGERGDRLRAQVLRALECDARPVTVFAPDEIPWNPKEDGGLGFVSPFDKMIKSTPKELRAAGLYDPIAIEWRSGPHCAVSVRLVAKALGAQVAQVDGFLQESWRACAASLARVRPASKQLFAAACAHCPMPLRARQPPSRCAVEKEEVPHALIEIERY